MSGGRDRTVRTWPIPGRAKPGAKPGSTRISEEYGIYWVPAVYSRDGQHLAMVATADTVTVHDAASGQRLQTYAGIRSCTALAYSPDGKLLAAVDSYYGQSSNPQGRLHLWDTETGKRLWMWENLGGYARSVAFTPDGKRVAASGGNGVRLWDVATGKLIRRFAHAGDPICFTPDGKTLVAGGAGVRLWNLDTGDEIERFQTDGVWGLALSPDGKILATGDDKHTLHLWDFTTGTRLGELTGHKRHLYTLRFSPDGKLLGSGSDDTTILLWDIPAALDGFAKLANAKPALPDLNQLWEDLGSADAKLGYKAIWALVAQTDKAVALCEERLVKAPARVDAKSIQKLIAQLDAKVFKQRDEAMRELRKLGSAVLPALREALKRAPTDETRRRLEQLLADHATETLLIPAGEPLRGVRAIEVLERIGTNEARQVLQVLAQGPPSRMVEHARKALERLKQREGAPKS